VSTYALIVAAGSSERFGGDIPKQFRSVCDRPLLTWTISRFEQATNIDAIVVVVAEFLLHTNQKIVQPYQLSKVTKIVIGGSSRAESVLNGLRSLPLSTNYVAIHDGARPLVTPDDIDRVVEMAKADRAAMLAIPVTDTVKRVADSYVLATLDRSKLFLAQTPQVFQFDLIKTAYEESAHETLITDDAALLESRGFSVRICVPESPNHKITTTNDLRLAEALLGENKNE